MKKLFAYLLTAALLVAVLDMLSGYFLFFYEKYVNANVETKQTPLLTVAGKLQRIALSQDNRKSNMRSTPSPFYVANDAQGYATRPGKYEITNSHPLKKQEYVWHARILDDGSRATAVRETRYGRTIYIFGDSYVFGWGLDDEHTFAWHLQNYAGGCDWNVKNISAGGYATTNMWLWFRDHADQVKPEDIVILGYADFYLPRNVADPQRMKEISEAMEREWKNDGTHQDLKHARGTLENGKIVVDYVNMLCANADGYCERKPYSKQYSEEVTEQMYKDVLQKIKGKVFVLFLSGQDTDGVIRFFHDRQVPVIDVRPQAYSSFVRDTVYDYDGHPGPLYNLHMYQSIRERIGTLVCPD